MNNRIEIHEVVDVRIKTERVNGMTVSWWQTHLEVTDEKGGKTTFWFTSPTDGSEANVAPHPVLSEEDAG